MRRPAVAFLLSAAALAACSPKEDTADGKPAASAANPIAAVTAPPRPRVGIWETTMTMGAPAPMTVTSQVCMDEAMVSDDSWMKGQQGQPGMADCQQAVQQFPGGYSFKSTCKMQQTTMVSEGRASGDFKSAYRMDITTRTEPAPPGGPAEMKMTVDARYVGPCAPGQVAGPIPGSVKMGSAG